MIIIGLLEKRTAKIGQDIILISTSPFLGKETASIILSMQVGSLSLTSG